MNALPTDDNTTANAVAPTATRSRLVGRLGRGLVHRGAKLFGVGLFAAVLGLGSLAATPAPAAAAGSTAAPDIYGCFTWGGGVAYSGRDVWLRRYNGSTGQWDFARKATTNSSGCVRFNDLAVGRYFRLYAYTAFGFPNCYHYEGYSGYIYTQYANDYLFRVGTTYADGPYALKVC